MVDGFPYEVPEEYQNMPLLKGRATVEMKVKVKDNPNLDECTFRIILDGYNAPVTAGNFVDLVERHFYDGMEIQRGKIIDAHALYLILGVRKILVMIYNGNSDLSYITIDIILIVVLDYMQLMASWYKLVILKVLQKDLLTPVQRKPVLYLWKLW